MSSDNATGFGPGGTWDSESTIGRQFDDWVVVKATAKDCFLIKALGLLEVLPSGLIERFHHDTTIDCSQARSSFYWPPTGD